MQPSSVMHQEKKFQLIALNCRYSHSCLALYYLRHALERHLPNCRVDILQLTINDPYYDTLLRLSNCGAGLLFFSVYIWNAVYTTRLIRDLARLHPDRPLILGGPQAPFLEKIPEQCTVVHGEIEGVEYSFYRDLEEGRLQPVYEGAVGQPFLLPYKREDFTGSLKTRQIYYESSRGCPHNCTYCLSSINHGVFHKDIATVQRELEEILAAEPKIIRFVDRTFNADTRRTLALWQFLAKCGGRTRFHFEIAPDRFTEEMFSFLEGADAELFQFEVGIQSCNAETLIAVNRRMDVALALGNIARLAALDTVHLHVDLILGLPYETAESFRESFNRVFLLRPHYIQMGLLKVLPETSMRLEAERFAMIFCEQPPYEILANRWLDHPTISRLHEFGECVEAFYNNRFFRSIWDYLVRRQEEPFAFFSCLRERCRAFGFFGLAPTQQLMTRILFDMVGERTDGELLHELLRYDWLRCGHRFLPEYLETVPLVEIRNSLWLTLPPNYRELYSHHSRDEFFKRTVFLKVSGAVLDELGMCSGEREGCLCFLPQQTTGVLKHSQVVLIDTD
jgi:radical SAM superfamily enzyme YgiQ (UPF0313 family)